MYNDEEKKTDYENITNRESRFEYSYSGGSEGQYPGSNPRGNNSGGFFRVFLTVALCVVLCFGSGTAGVMYGMKMAEQTAGTSVNPAPSGDSLHNSNPEELLGREEIPYSPYGSAGEDAYAISEVVRMVSDSVVVINATVMVTNGWGGATESSSAGSGVIIHEDGYILTCNHVVEGAKSVTVLLNDGVSQYAAALVGRDEASDLAALKIQPKEEQPLTAAKHGKSGYLVVGEHVVAIGNPLGTLGGTVTDGIISATERVVSTENGKMTLLQTNAAINSGNSGGGLFNLKGELIGIVNAKYAASGVEGLAFAIPIDSAYEVECDLIQYGYVRGIVDHGLVMVEVNASNLQSYRWQYGITEKGLYLVSSKYNSDLKNKDCILSINGISVLTLEDFDRAVESCKVGDVLTVEYKRDGKTYQTTITVQEYVPDQSLVDFS
ncbi:MAG: trypsin-like serine protease [Ruminococcaceae bacterium]|nr:trypsin-like serine protease [Oscillospiraceae bacterium]